jgi:ATP-dependent RNA helicase DHX57
LDDVRVKFFKYPKLQLDTLGKKKGGKIGRRGFLGLKLIFFSASGFYGYAEVTALLLAAGANVNLVNKLGLSAHQDMKGKRNGGRRKEERGRRKEEGGRRKEEGGRRKEEGGRRREEGGRRKEEKSRKGATR